MNIEPAIISILLSLIGVACAIWMWHDEDKEPRRAEMNLRLLTAVSALVVCSDVFAEEKTVTICEDYVSDGGYSYRVKEAGKRCQRAQSKTTKQRFRYINEGWGKNLYEQYLADEKIECAEFNALFLEGPPPKTIERQCETYIDNRAKEG